MHYEENYVYAKTPASCVEISRISATLLLIK